MPPAPEWPTQVLEQSDKQQGWMDIGTSKDNAMWIKITGGQYLHSKLLTIFDDVPRILSEQLCQQLYQQLLEVVPERQRLMSWFLSKV